MIQTILDFHGCTFNEALDGDRLRGIRKRVFDVMKDGLWRTKEEIAAITGDKEESIGRRLRELKAMGYGYEIHRRGDPKLGIWEYKIGRV